MDEDNTTSAGPRADAHVSPEDWFAAWLETEIDKPLSSLWGLEDSGTPEYRAWAQRADARDVQVLRRDPGLGSGGA